MPVDKLLTARWLVAWALPPPAPSSSPHRRSGVAAGRATILLTVAPHRRRTMLPIQKLPADVRATNRAVRAEELAARNWLVGGLEPLANPAGARRASARRAVRRAPPPPAPRPAAPVLVETAEQRRARQEEAVRRAVAANPILAEHLARLRASRGR